jgi:hypothetical protein
VKAYCSNAAMAGDAGAGAWLQVLDGQSWANAGSEHSRGINRISRRDMRKGS